MISSAISLGFWMFYMYNNAYDLNMNILYMDYVFRFVELSSNKSNHLSNDN